MKSLKFTSIILLFVFYSCGNRRTVSSADIDSTFRALDSTLSAEYISRKEYQEEYVKKLDFQSHNYEFYFFYQPNDFREDESLSLIKPFMINNKSKLERLREHWLQTGELGGNDREMPDYNVYIIENGSIIKQLYVINGSSEALYLKDSVNLIKAENYFGGIKGDSEVFEVVIETDTITKSRRLLKFLEKTDNIYPNYRLGWLKYDGKFRFEMMAKKGKVFTNQDTLESKIYKKFKNKDFLVDLFMLSNTEFAGGDFICDYSFYNEIKQDIPIWEDFELIIPDTVQWKPWHLTLTKGGVSVKLYSTDKGKLDNLKRIVSEE